jgi:hypothetical protein
MLLVVRHEVFGDDAGIAVDEGSLQNLKHDLLVVIH